jgi:hypothetical protein
MIEWIPVNGSAVLVAEAYDPETETIYVRFKNGGEWWYSACPTTTWEEFTAPGQSRGQYLNKTLKFKPNGRYGG